MQTYTKKRLKAYGLSSADTPLCQYCRRARITEIHHIEGRIGDLTIDIRNLIGLCRACHLKFHQKNDFETKNMLKLLVKNQLEMQDQIKNSQK